MRCCLRNKRVFKAMNYVGEVSQKVDGLLTGETIKVYTEPYIIKANISSATGIINAKYFGNDIAYNLVIAMDIDYFNSLKINNETIFFIDKNVEYDDTTPLYDYKVSRIAKTINQVLIAVKSV